MPHHPTTLQHLVATSLDAPEELLPYLPELLADLDELGAVTSDVLEALAPLGLTKRTRVLDLGCGKGAVGTALAGRFGCEVVGIDGMSAFVDRATQLADQVGVADRCSFRTGDVRDAAFQERNFDVVMMLALGSVFGDARDTVGALRQCVKPGGLVMIDDAWLDESRITANHDLPEELDYLHDRDTTRALLESHGDRIVAERIIDEPDARPLYEAMTAKIAKRASQLEQRLRNSQPDLARLMLDFVERQRSEVELLCGPIVGALWALRVPGDPGTPSLP